MNFLLAFLTTVINCFNEWRITVRASDAIGIRSGAQQYVDSVDASQACGHVQRLPQGHAYELQRRSPFSQKSNGVHVTRSRSLVQGRPAVLRLDVDASAGVEETSNDSIGIVSRSGEMKGRRSRRVRSVRIGAAIQEKGETRFVSV